MRADKHRSKTDRNQSQQAYVALQRHLNRQAVGFPATRSGAELKLLKHIFTPEEAEIATCLSYRPEPLATIFARAADRIESPEALERMLTGMQRKGGIETRMQNDRKLYCNAPLVVGMYELQIERLTPEFIRDFDAYTRDPRFGIEFLSTALPQMRTIPISKSIRVPHDISTFDEVNALLVDAEAPFVIIECICRKKKALTGHPCQVTDRKETCLAIGDVGQMLLQSGIGREIGREEAADILARNQKQGLVLQPANTQKVDFICSCCGCCCGMLGVHKSLPKPLEFWSSNFYAAVDPAICNGCGLCEKRCQVGAVRISAPSEPAVVDLDRCIGCGVCIVACPTRALSLVKKSSEVRPPKTRDDLYDVIMGGKKDRLSKMKLTAKLVIDAIRAGRVDLIK
jgi:ferredoxin